MRHVANFMTVTVTVVAMVAPSIGANLNQQHGTRQHEAVSRLQDRADTFMVDRQDRLWRKLSGTICAGCITSANRVPLVSYDKPNLADVAKAQPSAVKTVAQQFRATSKITHLRKRYARLHRRSRLRIVAQRHKVKNTKVAILNKKLPRGAVLPVQSIGWSGFNDRSHVLPTELPHTPHDDGPIHSTILIVSEARPRKY